MKISLTTFETELRRRFLDLVYSQWGCLGVPYNQSLPYASYEVIDPEALLWFSLEFLPHEPRLSEGVIDWLQRYDDLLIRQRLKRLAKPDDPRIIIWRTLDSRRRRTQDIDDDLFDSEDLRSYCRWLRERIESGQQTDHRVGKPRRDSSALLLEARDLLGSDTRHFILTYLLTHGGSGKLRTIASWSTFSYRSVSETANRWENIGVVKIDHGHCTLKHHHEWRALLSREIDEAIWINWPQVFASSIRLLRDVAKASQKRFEPDNAVVREVCREFIIEASDSLGGLSVLGNTTLFQIQDLIRDAIPGVI